MQKFLIYITLFICLLSFSTVFAETSNETIVIVNGNATIELNPDIAILYVDIITENKEAKIAQSENANKTNQLLEALVSFKLQNDAIKTHQFNIEPVYDVNYQHIQNYRVHTTLEICIDDLTQLGKIIDIALQNGANANMNIVYKSNQEAQAYEKALGAAYENAYLKAQALSASLHPSSINILKIEENGTHMNYANAKAALDYESTSTIQPNKVSVSANITVHFAIQK